MKSFIPGNGKNGHIQPDNFAFFDTVKMQGITFNQKTVRISKVIFYKFQKRIATCTEIFTPDNNMYRLSNYYNSHPANEVTFPSRLVEK